MGHYCFGFELKGLTTTYYYYTTWVCIDIDLEGPQDFNLARQFWYGQDETGLNGQNSRAKLKSYGHFRAKLKHALWLGDRKASLINCPENIFH